MMSWSTALRRARRRTPPGSVRDRACTLRPMIEDAEQDRLLARIGIERYRERTPPGASADQGPIGSKPSMQPTKNPPQAAAPVAGAAPSASQSRRASEAPSGLAELRASLSEPVASASAPTAAGSGAPVLPRQKTEDATSRVSADGEAGSEQQLSPSAQTTPAHSIDVLCLASDEVFIAAPATQPPDCHRLLEEIVIALELPKAPARLAFRWPDPALGSASEGADSERAWRAFWSRRAEPASRRYGVDDPTLRSLLGDSDVRWLPSLASVVGSADAKRALWQLLCDDS